VHGLNSSQRLAARPSPATETTRNGPHGAAHVERALGGHRAQSQRSGVAADGRGRDEVGHGGGESTREGKATCRARGGEQEITNELWRWLGGSATENDDVR
jgi:hypothetical protein